VEEELAPLKTPLEGGGIREVAVHGLDGESGEQATIAAGARQNAHTMARTYEAAHKRRADEPGSPGHDRHVAHKRLIAGQVAGWALATPTRSEVLIEPGRFLAHASRKINPAVAVSAPPTPCATGSATRENLSKWLTEMERAAMTLPFDAGPALRDLRRIPMPSDDTSVKVKIVTLAGVLIGKMSKPKNIRTLDALNLKGDFFALTEAATEGDGPGRQCFLAVNKHQVISLEEIP
jgi:hypothetical protein